jgi:carbonic anhydrase
VKRIVEGLAEFQNNVYPRHRELFERLKHNQQPSTLFITCSDSRIVPNLMLQADPGELFIIRTAGNMVPPYKTALGGGVAASIEYAVEVLGIRDIVLCAHSDCGAMKAVLHPEKVASLPAVAEWVKHGELARRRFDEEHPALEGVAALDRLAKLNVVQQLKHLVAYPFVRRLVEKDEIDLYGWFYRIESGSILTYDSASGEIVEVTRGTPGDWCERTLLRMAEAEEDLWDKL